MNRDKLEEILKYGKDVYRTERDDKGNVWVKLPIEKINMLLLYKEFFDSMDLECDLECFYAYDYSCSEELFKKIKELEEEMDE